MRVESLKSNRTAWGALALLAAKGHPSARSAAPVGMGAASVEYPVMPMLVKEITWVGSFRFINEFATAVSWLEAGRINPLPLLSAEYAPESIEEALIAAADKTRSSKVQITF